MLEKFLEPGDWFPPKRYGYGAGLPFAWQGWVLVIAYLFVVVGAGFFATHGDAQAVWTAIGAIVLATVIFVPIVRRRTRGGWRWRSGEPD